MILLSLAVAANLLSCVWHFFIVKKMIAPRLYREGYEQGRRDADNWWVNLEREVDLERQKIWREEG
jgi:hypothetical protein